MQQLDGGVVTGGLAGLGAAVHGYLTSVAGGGLGRVSDADVLAELRELETVRRRLAVADHALIGELDRRGLAGRLVMASTYTLVQGLLRLSPGEAKDRVAAARSCGSRTGLTGQPLPALLPVLAEAQAEGVVSGEHTRTILGALDDLPATAGAEDRSLAESIWSRPRLPCGRGRWPRSAGGSWPTCTPTASSPARRSTRATGRSR